MDRFYPKAEFPEDQKYSRFILYSHLTHKGLQVGSICGGLGGLLLFSRRRASSSLIKSLSIATNVGVATSVLALWGLGTAKMWGMEEIEWQDRAWRLQKNEKSMVMDTFTDVAVLGSLLIPGTPIGLAAGASVLSGLAYLKLFTE